jgi:hypothetical protein
MRNTLLQNCTRFALVIGCLNMTLGSAFAGAFTRGCAARDMQIMMLIEERETGGPAAEQQLSEALFAMMDARMICHQGRVIDALAKYDEIARSISTNPFLADRR